MPTGYTYKLMEEGMDFRTFVLLCARAMGACIMQRDDQMSDPPKIQDTSYYNLERSKECENNIAELRAMTPEQRHEYGVQKQAVEINDATASFLKEQTENKRLSEMQIMVDSWRPPTKDHQGLKDFMLEQLAISKHNLDYAHERVARAKEKPPEAFYVEDLSGSIHSVSYHQDETLKEFERVNNRNRWIESLYRSLPEPKL